MTKVKAKNKDKASKKTEIPVVDVYSLSGKKVDKFKLDPGVFNAKVHKDLLYQAITMYRANQRQGNASTKTRGEKRGGGKKPWRQKGTGRARVGSIRSPLWRGGGTTFGPRPRDFSYQMPKKMKAAALIASLSAKTRDNEIMVLEKDPMPSQPKTKEITGTLNALKIHNKKSLFLYLERNENLIRSCRNIKNLTLRLCADFNAYDVLLNARILFSRETHGHIVKRLKR